MKRKYCVCASVLGLWSMAAMTIGCSVRWEIEKIGIILQGDCTGIGTGCLVDVKKCVF